MGLVLVASFWFSVMAMLIKALGPELPVAWTAFLRNVLAVPVVLAAMRRGGLGLRTPHWARLCLRGLLGTAAMCCSFWALPRMPLANTMLLMQTTPLFAAVWGVVFMRERLDRPATAFMATAFAGVFLALRPTLAFAPGPTVAALASGLFGSLAMAAVKSLSKDEPDLRIIGYFALVSSAALAPWALSSGYWPVPRQWLMMGAAALAATGGQIFLTAGLREAPVSRATFGGLFMLVFNIAGGWAFWGEAPDAWTWLGCFLIIGGTLGLGKGYSAANASRGTAMVSS